MNRFAPVPLPESALGLMKFPEETRRYIEQRIREAEQSGCWLHAQEVPIDIGNRDFWAYWVYKTCHTITREYEGSGVEAALASFRQVRHDFACANFVPELRYQLSAAGDLLKTPGLEEATDRLYEDIAEVVFGVDIAYANLESTLSREQVGSIELSSDDTPLVNINAREYRTLVEHEGRRFDVLQLANNHILDCGDEGIGLTLEHLAQDGIAQAGVNDSEREARRAQVFEKDGLRIGWVAHTYGVNFKPFPPDKPWRVNMTDFHNSPSLDNLEAQIADSRSRCDLTIVALHWGLEFELFPHPVQRELAHRFADLGADIVIGHHPHVMQPVEIYRPDAERAVPILYSLGNLTPVISNPAAVLSQIARIDIAKGELNGDSVTRVLGLEVWPVLTLMEEGVLRLKYLQALLDDAEGEALGHYIHEAAAVADIVLGRSWREQVVASVEEEA